MKNCQHTKENWSPIPANGGADAPTFGHQVVVKSDLSFNKDVTNAFIIFFT